MADQELNDATLDALFDDLRSAPAPQMSQTLMARILLDADAQQPVPEAPRPGLLARIYDALGGWPALGGMTAAGLCGLWLGFAPPALLSDFETALTGDDVSVTLGADTFFTDLGEGS